MKPPQALEVYGVLYPRIKSRSGWDAFYVRTFFVRGHRLDVTLFLSDGKWGCVLVHQYNVSAKMWEEVTVHVSGKATPKRALDAALNRRGLSLSQTLWAKVAGKAKK